MEDWFQKAITNPWLFITGAIVFALWRIGKFLGNKLLGEQGVLPAFLDGVREDSKSMKSTMAQVGIDQVESNKEIKVAMTKGLAENKQAIDKLENQLVNAIQARPDDEELFDVLFTNNPIPICFVGPDHRFTRLNRACDEFFGYSTGELSLMTFDDLTADKDIQADIDNVERVAAGTTHRYRMEKTYIRKNGEPVKAVLHVFRYPIQGAFLHFISIIIPI